MLKLWSTVKVWLVKALNALRDPKFLLTFGIAWLITNGWSYIALVIGSRFKVNWLWQAGLGWQAILWFPFTIEKPITIAIAVWLRKVLFKEEIKDENI